MTDEIALQIRRAEVPSKCSEFSVEFIWKSVTFDRMFFALKSLAVDHNAVSSYIYHRIMGNDVEEPILKLQLPKKCV